MLGCSEQDQCVADMCVDACREPLSKQERVRRALGQILALDDVDFVGDRRLLDRIDPLPEKRDGRVCFAQQTAERKAGGNGLHVRDAADLLGLLRSGGQKMVVGVTQPFRKIARARYLYMSELRMNGGFAHTDKDPVDETAGQQECNHAATDGCQREERTPPVAQHVPRRELDILYQRSGSKAPHGGVFIEWASL